MQGQNVAFPWGERVPAGRRFPCRRQTLQIYGPPLQLGQGLDDAGRDMIHLDRHRQWLAIV